ncbi:MAG: hypothetical protein HY321_12045 [Armatimonadetes bacterium]|nr:hypothetical protein [Armatimonadota bacterium]
MKKIRFLLFVALLAGASAAGADGGGAPGKEDLAGACVAVLRARPDDAAAREGLRRLFTEDYPARLPADAPAYLPVPHVECRDAVAAGMPAQRAFYTTGLAFPDAGHRRDPARKATFTRVLHAYAQNREGGEWRLAFRALYNHNDAGAEALAPVAARALLRVRAAHRALVGETGPALSRPADLWICADGDGGAEQSGANLYLLGTARPREPLELLRQIAHEFGHLALPALGPLQAPEKWGNGFLGEVLYLRRLARAPAAPDSPVPPEALAAYVRHEVEPLARAFAAAGSGAFAGQEEGAGGLRLLLGMVLYLEDTKGADAVAQLIRSVRGSTLRDWIEAARLLPGE